jgi:hypothetical protein
MSITSPNVGRACPRFDRGPLYLDAAFRECSGPPMWRQTPKIVVLSAIGLLVMIFYYTQWNAAPPSAGSKGPGVVYINPGYGTGSR